MFINYVFYLVFALQIVLLSYYYPKKISERMKQVMEKYPPATHPKLYPQSAAQQQSANNKFIWVSRVILSLGLILAALLFYALEQNITSTAKMALVPLVFGLVQAIPYLMIEIISSRHLKLMRQLNTKVTRQAELAPRQLFSFIEPYKVFSAVALFLLCIGSVAYFEQFKLTADLLVLLVTMLLSNGLFVVLTLKLLYGKKLDPYQSNADRSKIITASVNSFVFTSVLISVYLGLNRSVDVFGLQDIEIIFNSLYWQLVALMSTGSMLRNNAVDDLNFEVYRA